jgi:hypothetical protein
MPASCPSAHGRLRMSNIKGNFRICCGQMIEWPAASESEVARAVAGITQAELSHRLESGCVARHSSRNGVAVAHRMKRGPHLWGRQPDQRSSRDMSSGQRGIDSPTKARRLPYRHAGPDPSKEGSTPASIRRSAASRVWTADFRARSAHARRTQQRYRTRTVCRAEATEQGDNRKPERRRNRVERRSWSEVWLGD